MRKFLVKFIPYFLVLVGFLIAFGMISGNRGVNAENNFYIRLQACVLSTPIPLRTAATINNCYDTVERQTGVHAHRYVINGYK